MKKIHKLISSSKDSLTLSAGLGFIQMIGAKVTVEKESKQNNIRKVTINEKGYCQVQK